MVTLQHQAAGPCRPARRSTAVSRASSARQTACQRHAAAPAASDAAVERRRLLLATGAALAAPLLPHGDGTAQAADEGGAAAQQAFFEVKVDGRPAGCFVVELFPDGGVAGARFADLARGREGVGFRRTRFELLEDAFIQDSGVKELSRRADGRTPIAGGPDTEELEEQLAAARAAGEGRRRRHDSAGLVSLAVLPRRELASKDKLVAVGGQLVTVTETFGEAPNGTQWAVTTAAAPELDATNLVVGHVVEGMEVVQALAALPRVRNNSDSPFFKAGKAAGDKRADVAERAFGKPFAKIVVDRCGLA